jgi:hypothetical protein
VNCSAEGGGGGWRTAWDSGKVASNATTNVEFGGRQPLAAGTSCRWAVRWWARDGRAAPVSPSRGRWGHSGAA